MATVNRSFSGPEDLIRASEERAKALGYKKYSQYLQALVEFDLGNPNARSHLAGMELRDAVTGATPKRPQRPGKELRYKLRARDKRRRSGPPLGPIP
jgi:hypothetical protein